MNINKQDKKQLIISPIVETCAKNGGGLLGFTIKHEDGSFENVMKAFTVQNHDQVLAELSLERKLTLKKYNYTLEGENHV